MFRTILLLLILHWQAAAQADLTQYVNPFIGTGQGAPDFSMGSTAGNTPPGAAFPFGMALWSPDTTTDSGGYRYEHNTIRGFSLTHFSGRGISCWQDLPFLPVAGALSGAPGDQWNAYASTFSHDHEHASPGYYSVGLDNGVRTELTVTRRSGFARFTFPADRLGTLLVDAGRSANGNWGGTSMNLAGDSELYGSITSGNCGGSFSYTLYFVVLFDQPAVVTGTWDHGAWLTFDTTSNAVVQAKVGLSFVSFTNAYINLTTESTGWDFDALRAQTAAAWNRRLSSIQVSGGTPDQTAIFYTALYHASIHPSTFSDVNGDYLGFDGRLHNTTRTQYHNIPAWDFHRSLVPLLAITGPDIASDLAQSLVNDAQQDPSGGLPRWVHAATDSCGMFGDDSPAVISTAYALGARDFDTAGALAAMIRDATQPGTTSAGCPVRDGLDDYLALGYVSTNTWGSAARTLEYATSDFAISQFAVALGDGTNAALFLQRAQNWRNLFRDGYIVPRKPTGQFVAGYNPDGCNGDAFIEGSGGQYSFMVRFNERALFNAIGGSAAAVARLDRHFQQLNAGPCSEFAFMGNEVSLKTPWMYNFAGAPWKTQRVVHRILSELYTNTPGGMPGNDDGGVLSSWVVFASLGLYPEISGVGGLAVATPVFPDAVIRLAGGGTIHIAAPAAGGDNTYVQSLRINGQDYASPWIPWNVLSSGAELQFDLGASANHSWGTQSDAMPSFDVGH
jgi:predicted alpha-1,2-mannosidase